MERFWEHELHFIDLNTNSLLSKIEELRYIAKSNNAVVIGTCESKLYASVLEQEGSLDSCKILFLRCNRNRHGNCVACYVRNNLSYNMLSVFSSKIKNIFFEILLPNSKQMTVGTIYCPPSQTNILDILNNNMIKINSVNNEMYILGDFNINLYLNDSYFLGKRNILSSKSIPSDVKSYHKFCTFFEVKELIKVPKRITSSN